MDVYRLSLPALPLGDITATEAGGAAAVVGHYDEAVSGPILWKGTTGVSAPQVWFDDTGTAALVTALSAVGAGYDMGVANDATQILLTNGLLFSGDGIKDILGVGQTLFEYTTIHYPEGYDKDTNPPVDTPMVVTLHTVRLEVSNFTKLESDTETLFSLKSINGTTYPETSVVVSDAVWLAITGEPTGSYTGRDPIPVVGLNNPDGDTPELYTSQEVRALVSLGQKTVWDGTATTPTAIIEVPIRFDDFIEVISSDGGVKELSTKDGYWTTIDGTTYLLDYVPLVSKAYDGTEPTPAGNSVLWYGFQDSTTVPEAHPSELVGGSKKFGKGFKKSPEVTE